ncbi:MAG: hypothetical protein DM484_12920 [Candidatus Methylumidiphilus alinenensis]|uniref:Uncharacterized protein n=1 Tax=Candidatus Methylumidiphilus alinenensis TaxID=2202197 RepID=A0A2W4R8H5_9GAMM|nr:MAG: hypothetical protein DM484_12920 [Candidatus Methylumidiphilus alinenensis]
MPESSHKDVKPWATEHTKSNTYAIGKLPSMALDSGIPAGRPYLVCALIPPLQEDFFQNENCCYSI